MRRQTESTAHLWSISSFHKDLHFQKPKNEKKYKTTAPFLYAKELKDIILTTTTGVMAWELISGQLLRGLHTSFICKELVHELVSVCWSITVHSNQTFLLPTPLSHVIKVLQRTYGELPEVLTECLKSTSFTARHVWTFKALASLLEGSSQWTSQAIIMQLIRGYAPLGENSKTTKWTKVLGHIEFRSPFRSSEGQF